MPVEHILLLESPVMDKGTMDTGMHACIMMHDACMYQDHASCPGFGGSGIQGRGVWGSGGSGVQAGGLEVGAQQAPRYFSLQDLFYALPSPHIA